MKCGRICPTNVVKFSVSGKPVFTQASKNPLMYKAPFKRKENHLSHYNIKAISVLRKAKMHSFIESTYAVIYKKYSTLLGSIGPLPSLA